MGIDAVVTSLQNVRRLLYMFGAVTQVELKGFLDVNSIDSETRKREIKAEWATAASRFEELRRSQVGEPETIAIEKLDAATDDRIAKLAADPIFVNTFSNYPYAFEKVEIAKLVACQRTVHVEYIEKLKTNFEKTGRDLFSFCLPPGQDTTPVTVGRTAQNAFTASSENPGLRFLGAYEQAYQPGLLDTQIPGGQPVHAIILVLGYGGSTANAYRVGKRLILNNGFHRLYTLELLGISHVPLVVQQITHPKLELPPMMAELPRDYLVEDPRPGLMKDFLDKTLTCEITQRGFTKALQVGWGINESIIPR